MESERKVWVYVRIRCLFVWQRDVQADRARTDLESSSVGGLHDAGPAPGDDDEVAAILLLKANRYQAGEVSRLFVMARLFDPTTGSGQFLSKFDVPRGDTSPLLQCVKAGERDLVDDNYLGRSTTTILAGP